MDFRSFNNELSLAQIQFMSIFSGIVISRDKKDGKTKDLIIPCVFGQRSRILKNLETPDLAIKQPLPVIVIERNGFSRDEARVANLHLDRITAGRLDTADLNYLSPNPINISYNVSIITKYPGDMDKIVSNFLPFFNGDVYVRIPHPKIKDSVLNCQVLWGGSVSEEWQSEKDAYSDDIQVCTLEFTYKTYLFGGQGATIDLLHPEHQIEHIGGKTYFDKVYPVWEKYQVDGKVDLSTLDKNLFPDEVWEAIYAACPDGILTEEIANKLDGDHEETGYRSGMKFYATPLMYTSSAKFMEDVISGDVSCKYDYDVFQRITTTSVSSTSSEIIIR